MKDKNKTGKFIIIRYPDSYDCCIERFNTLKELEEAVKDNCTGSPVIACMELEQKIVINQ
jgi:hypothetical protein